MIDFVQYFKNKSKSTITILNTYDFKLMCEKDRNKIGNEEVKSYEYEFTNAKTQIEISLRITRFENQTYVASFSMYNQKENDHAYSWRTFHLSDYIKDNHLQDQFKYKIQGDVQVEEFIDQYFKNLEFALNDYLKPYVTGEKYIDHYVRMMDDYYAQTSALQMQQEIIKEHLAKQGKMAIFRQMVIGLKQDARNYMDKVKNFFLPPNQR